MPIFAAIDIGSNAIRCAIGTLENDALKCLATQREPVRLGGDVFDGSLIKPATIEKAVKAISNLLAFAKLHNAEKIRAVATSAVREAHNQKQFLAEVKEKTGLTVEVISGTEEGRLIHLAVSTAVDLSKGISVLLDIGGGSVEVSLVRNDELLITESIELGAVRMLPLLARPAGSKLLERFIRQAAEDILSQVREDISENNISTLIATGGNLEALGELKVYLKKGGDPHTVSAAELKEIVDQLAELTVEERIKKLELRPDRADVIYPASLVVKHIISYLKLETIIIPGVGLREGVLVELLRDAQSNDSKKKVVASLFTYALKLGKKYRLNNEHAKKVRELSASLFELFREEHKLPDRYRSLFELAALLHDVGQFIAMKGHHKHSETIIESEPFPGLSDSDRHIVAALARYHRKSPPSTKHPIFDGLSANDREVVVKLSPILRIADALDRSHENKISRVQMKKKDKKIILEISGDEDCSLELWAVDKKKDLFEKVYDTKLEAEYVK
jgi:exopolyphosphatase/guanosine-5'-triphosphate,3'-diphosphate pyrophosphatase